MGSFNTFQPMHFQEVLLNALSPSNEYLSVKLNLDVFVVFNIYE